MSEIPRMKLAKDILTLLGHTTNAMNRLTRPEQNAPAGERRSALQQLGTTVEAVAKLAGVAHVDALMAHHAAGGDVERIRAETDRLRAETEKMDKEVDRLVAETEKRKLEMVKMGYSC